VAWIFLLIALLLSSIAALLYFAADRKVLNVVDYGAVPCAARANRRAALRLLLPVFVNLGCAGAASVRPALAVPLLFLTPISVLCAVIWIAAGFTARKQD
jgi:hypothetical protein